MEVDRKQPARNKVPAAYPVGALFRLTLVQLLRTRRVFLYVVVLLLPLGFSLYVWLGPQAYTETLYLWGIIFVVAYLNFIIPFVALFHGTALIGPEHEAQTLAYLVTRPVPRWLTALVKYAAAAVVCIAGVALSMLVAYAVLGLHFGWGPLFEHFRYWLRLAGVAGVALLVYLALFLFVGMRFRRGVVVGLVFIVLWEGLVGLIPGIIRFVTVTHYLRSLAIHATRKAVTLPRFITVKEAPLSASLLAPVALWAVMLALSLWYFTQAEFQPTSDRR